MELFELILILLACVIVSAIIDQAVSKVSLPLIQIAIGFVVSLLLPGVTQVQLDSELFLVLFIAPLLFDEARHANKHDLWTNKWPILSLAIGLVLAIVLTVGYTLKILVPSIPLATAFACAAALGPTDAAAVGALGSTVKLNKRQSTLLSGEALINDASGVVAFQFAVSAALTGAFSITDALGEFARLFFGGIAFGALLGAAFGIAFALVRRRGLESTTAHVLYEVLTPFVVFLAAEAIGTSGILAVVAAGLVMSTRPARLSSTAAARNRLVSRSVWEVIIFLINGVLFVMLGMQLPQAMSPTLTHGGLAPWQLIGIVLILSAVLILTRLIWTSVMEFIHRDPQTGKRGWGTTGAERLAAFKRALITTVAGPKGAVTLSIIFTLPYMYSNGYPFTGRDLVIFLTAGVILTTLLVADFALPRLARTPGTKKPTGDYLTLNAARDAVLRGVVRELEAKIAEHTKPDYEPATRMVIAQYRERIGDSRPDEVSDEDLEHLQVEVLARQQAHLSEVVESGAYSVPVATRYAMALSRVKRSTKGGVNVGDRASNAVRGIRMSPSVITSSLRRFFSGELIEGSREGAAENEEQDKTTSKPAASPRGKRGARHNQSNTHSEFSAPSEEEIAEEVGRPSRHALRDAAESAAGVDEAEQQEMCALAIDMEQVAVDYLKGQVVSTDASISAAAVVMLRERYAVLETLQARADALKKKNTKSDTPPTPVAAQITAAAPAAVQTSKQPSPAASTATAPRTSEPATPQPMPHVKRTDTPRAYTGVPTRTGAGRIRRTPLRQQATRVSEDARNTVRRAYRHGVSRLIGQDTEALPAIGSEQEEQVRAHIAEVESRALSMELEQIGLLHSEGLIDNRTSRRLREDVYLLQMGLSER